MEDREDPEAHLGTLWHVQDPSELCLSWLCPVSIVIVQSIDYEGGVNQVAQVVRLYQLLLHHCMSPVIGSVSNCKDEDGSPKSAGILTHLEEAISLV